MPTATSDEQRAEKNQKAARAAFQARVNADDAEQNVYRRVYSVRRERAANRVADFSPNASDLQKRADDDCENITDCPIHKFSPDFSKISRTIVSVFHNPAKCPRRERLPARE